MTTYLVFLKYKGTVDKYISEKTYQELLKYCLESNTSVSAKELKDQLENHLNATVSADLQTDTIQWEDGLEIANKMWTTTWHPEYGFCDTFQMRSFDVNTGIVVLTLWVPGDFLALKYHEVTLFSVEEDF